MMKRKFNEEIQADFSFHPLLGTSVSEIKKKPTDVLLRFKALLACFTILVTRRNYITVSF